MVTRQEQREMRRQEILWAALGLFVRKGFAGTKVSDIADEVGMSTGLMFNYFDSKEALYEELVALGVSGPMGAVARTSGDALEFFERSAEEILGYLRDQPQFALMFVFMAQALYGEPVSENAKKLLAGLDAITPTVAIVERGQREGTIREGDPRALSIAFWCAIQGIAEELAVNPGMPCPESTWIVDIVRKR